ARRGKGGGEKDGGSRQQSQLTPPPDAGVSFLGLRGLRPGDRFNEYTIGRSAKADVTAQKLVDGGDANNGRSGRQKRHDFIHAMVSNRHCRVYCLLGPSPSGRGSGRAGGEMEVFAEDTSGNGTLVNGTTLLRRNERRRLHTGDVICLLNPRLLERKLRSPADRKAYVGQYSYVFVNLYEQEARHGWDDPTAACGSGIGGGASLGGAAERDLQVRPAVFRTVGGVRRRRRERGEQIPGGGWTHAHTHTTINFIWEKLSDSFLGLQLVRLCYALFFCVDGEPAEPRRANIVQTPPQLPSPYGSSGFGSAAQFLNVDSPRRVMSVLIIPHLRHSCRIGLKHDESQEAGAHTRTRTQTINFIWEKLSDSFLGLQLVRLCYALFFCVDGEPAEPRRANIVQTPPQLPSPYGSSGFGSAAQFLDVDSSSLCLSPLSSSFETVDCRMGSKHDDLRLRMSSSSEFNSERCSGTVSSCSFDWRPPFRDDDPPLGATLENLPAWSTRDDISFPDQSPRDAAVSSCRTTFGPTKSARDAPPADSAARPSDSLCRWKTASTRPVSPGDSGPGGLDEERMTHHVDSTASRQSFIVLPPADCAARPPDSLCRLWCVPRTPGAGRPVPPGGEGRPPRTAPQGPAGAPPEVIDDVNKAARRGQPRRAPRERHRRYRRRRVTRLEVTSIHPFAGDANRLSSSSSFGLALPPSPSSPPQRGDEGRRVLVLRARPPGHSYSSPGLARSPRPGTTGRPPRGEVGALPGGVLVLPPGPVRRRQDERRGHDVVLPRPAPPPPSDAAPRTTVPPSPPAGAVGGHGEEPVGGGGRGQTRPGRDLLVTLEAERARRASGAVRRRQDVGRRTGRRGPGGHEGRD
ncbi:hypothetical protein THAOC_20943, partial [Thalassiosira oceanica]